MCVSWTEAHIEPTGWRYNSSICTVAWKPAVFVFFLNDQSLRVYYWLSVHQQPSFPALRPCMARQTGLHFMSEGNGSGPHGRTGVLHLWAQWIPFWSFLIGDWEHVHTEQCCWHIRQKARPGLCSKIILELHLPEENCEDLPHLGVSGTYSPTNPTGVMREGWEAWGLSLSMSPIQGSGMGYTALLSPSEPLFSSPQLYWDIIDLQHVCLRYIM